MNLSETELSALYTVRMLGVATLQDVIYGCDNCSEVDANRALTSLMREKLIVKSWLRYRVPDGKRDLRKS